MTYFTALNHARVAELFVGEREGEPFQHVAGRLHAAIDIVTGSRANEPSGAKRAVGILQAKPYTCGIDRYTSLLPGRCR